MFWITVPQLAEEGHISPDTIYQLARREEDPLPLRYINGARYGQVLVSELTEWVQRNGILMRDKKKDEY